MICQSHSAFFLCFYNNMVNAKMDADLHQQLRKRPFLFVSYLFRKLFQSVLDLAFGTELPALQQ